MKIKTLLLLIAFAMGLGACANKPTAYEGIIETIENGKDGYVATLKDSQGGNFEAIFSIPNMGTQFNRWAVGDALSIKGDTIHINNTYRVIAREAHKQ
ncbi:hypothetical protein [Emticicia sp. 17c]|uniref:hypothetical protein n=1 Tax=Emticicia sp. 17c TaxID=3127704 RepID=UPI00301C3CE5